MTQTAFEVTPDTRIPSMLQGFAQLTGESYYICESCLTPYVTHQHYRNPNKCIDCSGERKTLSEGYYRGGEEEGMIELIHGDCMPGMARYPDKYFELALVDVPYGIESSISKGGGKPYKIIC